jgi:hypothetical protein
LDAHVAFHLLGGAAALLLVAGVQDHDDPLSARGRTISSPVPCSLC